jgi:hypothetical protein
MPSSARPPQSGAPTEHPRILAQTADLGPPNRHPGLPTAGPARPRDHSAVSQPLESLCVLHTTAYVRLRSCWRCDTHCQMLHPRILSSFARTDRSVARDSSRWKPRVNQLLGSPRPGYPSKGPRPNHESKHPLSLTPARHRPDHKAAHLLMVTQGAHPKLYRKCRRARRIDSPTISERGDRRAPVPDEDITPGWSSTATIAPA